MSALASVGNLVKREPAVLMSLAAVGVSLGTSFGLHLNVQQTREVYTGAATLTALLIRQAVTPSSKSLPKPDSTEHRLEVLEAAVEELAAPKARAAN